MRDEELVIAQGVLKFPVMLAYMEFSISEVSMQFYNFINYLKDIDIEKLSDGGEFIALMHAKRKGVIKEDFYESVFHMDMPYNTRYIEEAYLMIKEQEAKRILSEKLSTLDFEKDDLTEIKEMITEHLETVEIDANEFVESIADILPRADKPQESLISFYHKELQSKVAIDRNHLFVIGARPFTGKTTFSVKLAMENSVNFKTLYYSCEMTKEQLARKTKHYKNGHSNMFVKYQSRISVQQIRRDIKNIKPKFIVIDQLNKVIGKGRNKFEQTESAVTELKVLAVQMDIPIVLLSQINRTGLGEKRPTMANLKNAGAIEEEADVVFILNIEADECTNKTFTRVYVDKNRSLDGYGGFYDFNFDLETNKYTERI